MAFDPHDCLTASQAAARLCVCPRTLMRLRRDGGGPAYTRIGLRRVVYRQADLDAWTASRRFDHRAAEAAAKNIAATASK